MTNERYDIIRAVQSYCADVHEAGVDWTEADGLAVATLINQDDDPVGLFRFMDEKTGHSSVGYKTRDGRDWFHILRQMRNRPRSGLLENLRR